MNRTGKSTKRKKARKQGNVQVGGNIETIKQGQSLLYDSEDISWNEEERNSDKLTRGKKNKLDDDAQGLTFRKRHQIFVSRKEEKEGLPALMISWMHHCEDLKT